MNLQLIRASNGVGEPVQATITALRNIGSTTISVDSLTNWPANFIATTGNKLTNGTLDPSTVIVFSGHTAGSNTIIIDALAPGYADQLSNVGNIVIIKPATLWADNLADTMAVAHNDDGSLKTTAVPQVDWAPITTVPTLNASNGQREYQLKFAGVDLTTKLQQGTKLKLPRTSTAPTQSMSFVAASSQYASKATPAGITFTSAFTCEAWIYVNSYANNATIISRRDGSNNGWELRLNGTNGQLEVLYASAGYTSISSYQSIPLKRWVHVAGVVSNVSTKTASLYIDGVLVPSFINLTAVTTLTQAGNLQVGAANSVEFFDGFISEARVWSVAQTSTQILNNMNISLVGNETNLVFCAQGNGNFNDKTANANNLTASGGALATQLSNPKNAIEYAIATSVSKVAADTLVTVFTPTGTGIPNETLGTASYSSARAPYGFPATKSKWTIETPFLSTSGLVTNSSYTCPYGVEVFVPTGSFTIRTQINMQSYQNGANTNTNGIRSALSTNTSSATGYPSTIRTNLSMGNYHNTTFNVEQPVEMIAVTPVYYVFAGLGTSTSAVVNPDGGVSTIIAECAYL